MTEKTKPGTYRKEEHALSRTGRVDVAHDAGLCSPR